MAREPAPLVGAHDALRELVEAPPLGHEHKRADRRMAAWSATRTAATGAGIALSEAAARAACVSDALAWIATIIGCLGCRRARAARSACRSPAPSGPRRRAAARPPGGSACRCQSRSTRIGRRRWTVAGGDSSCDMANLQPVARRSCRPLRGPGRELENRPGTPPGRHPPRAQAFPHVQHGHLAVEEHGVDRKAHEPGVDRRGGAGRGAALPMNPSPLRPGPRIRVGALSATTQRSHTRVPRGPVMAWNLPPAPLCAQIPASALAEGLVRD